LPLPRVLIIGQTFNKKSGGGITQSNLFSGWDKDKIAVTGTAHILHDSENEICTNYYQLGILENKWVFPFNFLQRKFYSGKVEFKGDNGKSKISKKNLSIRSKLVDNIFYPFLHLTGLYHSFSKINLSPNFCNWLDDFNPDIIYAQGQDRSRVLLSLLVQSYLKKPMVYHVMDDWPSLIKNKGWFKRYWYKKIDRDFRNLLNNSCLLMGISDSMAEEYKIRYNKDFITFHNPVQIEFWKGFQRNSYDISDNPTILYAGRIGLGIDLSLEQIAKSIDLLNERHNLSLKFNLQVPEAPEWRTKYKCVDVCNFVPYNDLPRKFAEADFLILPYDFSKHSIRYIQYSMPTKAPEYMISGTPIIVYSPKSTAIVKYAEKYQWAQVVTENNIESLSKAIMALITNKDLRTKIASNAKKIAEEKHNSFIVSRNFKDLICSIAQT
jgi:glycosyltransferase involved in cell wall biosynthesis